MLVNLYVVLVKIKEKIACMYLHSNRHYVEYVFLDKNSDRITLVLQYERVVACIYCFIIIYLLIIHTSLLPVSCYIRSSIGFYYIFMFFD